MKPNLFTRIIAAFLVLCLLPLSGFSSAFVAQTISPLPLSLFSSQALSAEVVNSAPLVDAQPRIYEAQGATRLEPITAAEQDLANRESSGGVSRRDLLKSALLLFLPNQEKPTLSPAQKALLRQRMDRYAAHYNPAMSEVERQTIIDEVVIDPAPKGIGLKEWGSNIASLIVSGAMTFLSFRMRSLLSQARELEASDGRITRLQMMSYSVWLLSLSLWLVTGMRLASTFFEAKFANREKDTAGSFQTDKRIHFPEDIIQRPIDERLEATFDHELAHLFGVRGLGLIRGDIWLAYAYETVLAMEHGGTPLLRHINDLKGSSGGALYMFYLGVVSGSEKTSGLQEEVLRIIVEKLAGPVDPSLKTDDPLAEPKALANISFAVGLAGTAWVQAHGNAELALTYLDVRGAGQTPAAAQRLIQEKLTERPDMSSLIDEAKSFIASYRPARASYQREDSGNESHLVELRPAPTEPSSGGSGNIQNIFGLNGHSLV